LDDLVSFGAILKPKHLSNMLSKENHTINDRIQAIIDYYKLNKNSFSKRINVNSSVIHHIVTGKKNGSKNKPSFDLLEKILIEFENIDANWLVTGKGNILKENNFEEENTNLNPFTIEDDKDKYIEALKVMIQDLQADKEELYNLLQNAIKRR